MRIVFKVKIIHGANIFLKVLSFELLNGSKLNMLFIIFFSFLDFDNCLTAYLLRSVVKCWGRTQMLQAACAVNSRQ